MFTVMYKKEADEIRGAVKPLASKGIQYFD